MTTKIVSTEHDFVEFSKKLRTLLEKAPRKDNLEELSEFYDVADEIASDLEGMLDVFKELADNLDSLGDHYSLWEDEENDRDTRMEARDNIENTSQEIITSLDAFDGYIED